MGIAEVNTGNRLEREDPSGNGLRSTQEECACVASEGWGYDPKKLKSVHFDERVRVRRTYRHDEMSTEERKCCWYAKDELRSIHGDNRRTVSHMQTIADMRERAKPWGVIFLEIPSEDSVDNDIQEDESMMCSRGLEHMVGQEPERRHDRRLKYLFAVVDHQERGSLNYDSSFSASNNWDESLRYQDAETFAQRWENWEIVANACIAASRESKERARRLGLEDEKTAAQFTKAQVSTLLNELLLCTPPSTKKTRCKLPAARAGSTRHARGPLSTIQRSYIPNAA